MTIESSPQSYSSANDLLVWVAYDSNSVDITKLNYKYVADVYINAVLVFRSKVYPNPVNDRGIFDLGSVIREYLYAKFKAEQGANEFSLSVTVKIGEEFNGVLYTNIKTSLLDVFNTYNSRTSSLVDLSNYVDKPATDRPLIIEMTENTATYYLPYFALLTTPFNVVINGVTTTITPTVIETMHRINIAINAISDYTVVIAGITYQVRIVCAGMYKNYQLHFINRWGGWETMLFNKVSKKRYTVEKKSWQQQAYRIDGSGVMTTIVDNVMHTQKGTFSGQFMESLKISTDFLSDGDYQWLSQLINSPIVYLQDGAIFYQVTISDTDYEFKENITDGLTNLNVNLEFGQKYNTQFQ